MKRMRLSDLMHVGLLVLVPGMTAWLFGKPLLFPSLGPSAFELVRGRPEDATARKVIGGHFAGVICGFIAYKTLAHGLSLADLGPALTSGWLRIAASGVLSVVLTAWAMSATRTNHAPACATTLIVSLGLLPHYIDLLLIMVAVLIMFWLHRFILMIFLRFRNEE